MGLFFSDRVTKCILVVRWDGVWFDVCNIYEHFCCSCCCLVFWTIVIRRRFMILMVSVFLLIFFLFGIFSFYLSALLHILIENAFNWIFSVEFRTSNIRFISMQAESIVRKIYFHDGFLSFLFVCKWRMFTVDKLLIEINGIMFL